MCSTSSWRSPLNVVYKFCCHCTPNRSSFCRNAVVRPQDDVQAARRRLGIDIEGEEKAAAAASSAAEAGIRAQSDDDMDVEDIEMTM